MADPKHGTVIAGAASPPGEAEMAKAAWALGFGHWEISAAWAAHPEIPKARHPALQLPIPGMDECWLWPIWLNGKRGFSSYH